MKRLSTLLHTIASAVAFLLISCDDNTGTLGLFPQQDAISTEESTFDILSNSIANNNVPASSTACYLGKVIDPETDEAVTATFAAQFHTFEDYAFPDLEDIVPNKKSGLLCDSIEIRLFIKSVFGDKNNPMKIAVWPLSMDENKQLKESDKLYTDTDLRQYVDAPEIENAYVTKVITATDYIMSDAQRASTTYSDNIRIVLPPEYGDKIMKAYYSDHDNFKDSYAFIHNVCAGFLFRTISGTGTMLCLDASVLNLFFSYKSQDNASQSATCRFAATPEVIQSTQFESSSLSGLLNEMNAAKSDTTMLKTPAGICTELVLPINKIFEGHESDSISRASFTLTRFNNQDKDAKDDDYALGIPQNLLLVRKKNLSKFFEEHQVADQMQSFTTVFLNTKNCYTFDNISRLLSYCHNEKIAGMKATGLTEEDWEAANPDWDHVVIVPVTVATNTDSYNNVTLVSVNHDLSLCSTKLVRGTEANPIKMQVIYSRFAKQ